MNSMPNHRAENRDEATNLLAYHLWQQAHCPPGDDLKFWLLAEEQLFGKHDRQFTAKAKAAATARSATPSAGKSRGKSQSKPAKQQSKSR